MSHLTTVSVSVFGEFSDAQKEASAAAGGKTVPVIPAINVIVLPDRRVV